MNNRGITLVICILLILTLSVLGSAVLLRSVSESRVAQRYFASGQAFWVAEAGVQKTLWELNYNSCAGFVQSGTSTACTSCSNCGSGNKTMAVTLSGYGDYDLVLNNANTTVTSTGYYPSRTASSRVQRNVKADLTGNSLFNYAAFAQGNVTLSKDILIDSYNSNNGDYGGSNVGTSGNVGTNGTNTGAVNIDKNTTIKGNVSTGPNGTVTTGDNVTITGSTTHSNSVTLTPVTVPSSLTSLSSGGTYSLGNNDTGMITSGDYKYSDISLGKNSILTISGSVKIYLTSSSAINADKDVQVSLAANSSLIVYTDGVVDFSKDTTLNNTSKIPSKFIIYSTYTSGSATGVKLAKNGSFYGAIYAPGSGVDIKKDGIIYGAVVGKTISFDKNINFHYDQALNSVGNVSGYKSSNWQEQ